MKTCLGFRHLLGVLGWTLFCFTENFSGRLTFLGGGWLLGILFGFMENLTGGSTALGGAGGDSFWYEETAVWDFDLSGGMRGYSFCFE